MVKMNNLELIWDKMVCSHFHMHDEKKVKIDKSGDA